MIKKFKETVIINQGLQIPITERFKTNENGGFFYITNEFLKDGKDKYYIQNAPKSVICNKNDILMTRTGNTGMVVSNVEGVFHNNFFKIEYKENYDRLFLIQLLKSTYIQKKIKSLCGVSTIPDLNHGDFYSIEHEVPSLDKQKQIGNFLSNVDKLIESKREEIKLKEEYKKGIIQKIFNKEIRFKDEDGNYYPEWEEKKLGDIAEIYQPQTLSKDQLDVGIYKVFGANGYIGFHSKYNHNLEQVTISCRGENSGNVNFIQEKTWITGNSMVINIDKNALIDKQFLYHHLNNINFKKYITGGAQPQLTGNVVKLINVCLPCKKEQIQIGQFVNYINKNIKSEESKIENLITMKKHYLNLIFK